MFSLSSKNLRLHQPFTSSLLQTGPPSYGASHWSLFSSSSRNLSKKREKGDRAKVENTENKEKDGRRKPNHIHNCTRCKLSKGSGQGASSRILERPWVSAWKGLRGEPGPCLQSTVYMCAFSRKNPQITSDTLIVYIALPTPQCGPVKIAWTGAWPGF